MHEDAVCQHHRDSTYTVPYASAYPICELRSIRLGISILCSYGDNYGKKLPDIRVAPGVFVHRVGGIRVLAGGESPQG